MKEEERSFEIKNKNIEEVSKKIKNVFQDILDFDTSTEIYVSFFKKSIDPQFQKENKIVIHHDTEKIFVLVKGDLSEMENDIIWNKTEKIVKNLGTVTSEKDEELIRDDLIKNVVERVKNEGFQFTIEEAEKFINNFKKKFNRYPKNDEIDSIGFGYIQMLNEKMVIEEGKEDKNKQKIDVSSEKSENPSSLPKENMRNPDQKDKKEVILNKDGIMEILKTEGRRSCPICGNQNVSTIRESIDKTTLISHFPKIFAKKFQCRLCNCEWKET